MSEEGTAVRTALSNKRTCIRRAGRAGRSAPALRRKDRQLVGALELCRYLTMASHRARSGCEDGEGDRLRLGGLAREDTAAKVLTFLRQETGPGSGDQSLSSRRPRPHPTCQRAGYRCPLVPYSCAVRLPRLSPASPKMSRAELPTYGATLAQLRPAFRTVGRAMPPR
jgi:hypothetical protein